MKAYFGPSHYAQFPVIVSAIDFLPSGAIDVDRVRSRMEAAFPGWLDKCPETGKLTANDALHLICAYWSMGLLNSVQGMIAGAGIHHGKNGAVESWAGFHVPELTAQAMQLSMRAMRSATAVSGQFPDAGLQQEIQKVQDLCRRLHPDSIAQILMRAAQAADIPMLRYPLKGKFLPQYGWGCRGQTFNKSAPAGQSILGTEIARNKVATTEFLKALGFPATHHLLASTVEEALAHARTLGWPLVVKPLDRGMGNGVTAGIRTDEGIARAFAVARRFTKMPIMVERFVQGSDHRLNVVRGKLVAAVRRDPPTVIGNNVSTVRELIFYPGAYMNSPPRFAPGLLAEEPEVESHLAAQGLSLDTVPAAGQQVTLRSIANVSTGGSATDVLDQVHPDVRSVVESIAVNLGLEHPGIDYITTDISRSWRDVPGCIIEINPQPGISEAVTKNIGRLILGSSLGRIPLVIVVASGNEQEQLIAALGKVDHMLDPGTAILGPGSSRIGNLQLEHHGLSWPERVVQILANRQTTGAVIVSSPDDILNFGMPVDRSDLSIMRSALDTEDQTRQLLARYSTLFVDASSGQEWPSRDVVNRITSALSGKSS